jgi:hypothetical protein
MAQRDDRVHQAGGEPIEEPLQADPNLRQGAVRPWAKWTVAFAVAFVVCVVLYGLNASGPEPQGGSATQSSTGASPPASSATTGTGAK